MAKGAGKKRRGAAAPKVEQDAPPRSEVTALGLPDAPAPPARADVSALQLPGAPPPRTQPEVDTTRRPHGVLAPSQATALQLPGAPPQPRQAEVAPRPLAIVPAPAHVPPQADVSVSAPELKKNNKKKDKKKSKKPTVPDVRRPTALLYRTFPGDRKKKDDRKKKKQPEPQPEPPVPVIVDGETVPAEIVKGYKRYCRIAESSSATTTVCHLCVFDLELHPNGIVRTFDMIAHCIKHKSAAVRCGRFGCAAKVPPGLDLRWHTHFCHDLPSDWWRIP
ncbi:hypothetical protein ZWY2020_031815 [Hordeum vulgare]|nr:hypothetical protein ZWY2020_031815 [Hordeum vulgare]